jgi:hypothetical protein
VRGEAIEVKARVQQMISRQPARAERDFVLAASGDGFAGEQCRLNVIVHVLLRAGRDEAQDVIAGIRRIKSRRGCVRECRSRASR